MKKILLTREALFVAFNFFLFAMLKTQFFNLNYLILDATIYEDNVSENFTLHYGGSLIGCLELGAFMSFLEGKNYLFKNAYWILPWTISAIALVVFVINHNTFKSYVSKWVTLLIACFVIYDALEISLSIMIYTEVSITVIFIASIFVVLIGVFTFIWRLNRAEKLQIILLAFPACVLGAIFWYSFLGPMILPMSLK